MSWYDLWPNTLAQLLIAATGVESEAAMAFIALMSIFVWFLMFCVAMVAPCAVVGYVVFKWNKGKGDL